MQPFQSGVYRRWHLPLRGSKDSLPWALSLGPKPQTLSFRLFRCSDLQLKLLGMKVWVEGLGFLTEMNCFGSRNRGVYVRLPCLPRTVVALLLMIFFRLVPTNGQREGMQQRPQPHAINQTHPLSEDRVKRSITGAGVARKLV